MHKFKKITAAMVTAAMMMSIVPFAAFADETEEEVTDPQAVVEEVEEAEEETEAEAEAEEAAEEEEKEEEAPAAPSETEEDKVAEEKEEVKKAPANDQEAAYETTEEKGAVKVRSGNHNADELYEEYAYLQFYGANATQSRSSIAGSNLSGGFRELYDSIRSNAKMIADGQLDSSSVECSGTFTANEISSYSSKSAILKKVFNNVYLDSAYEFYWFDLSYSYSTSTRNNGNGTSTITFGIDFAVNQIFRGDNGDYSINTEKTGAVKHSVVNAMKIVNDAKGLSDYRKIEFYKDRICELVEYDTLAAKNGTFHNDNSPWNLVNVFDYNDKTNVVCEGYSEAFQYLCEHSVFDDAYAYSVTGTMNGGDHKWNIVHIGNENYLLDVTNSDKAHDFGNYFLVGTTEGSYDTQYVISWEAYSWREGSFIHTYPAGSTTFAYDEDSLGSYTPEQLTLSDHKFIPPESQNVNIDDIIHPVGMDLELKDDIAMNLYVETKDGLQAGDKVVITAEGKKPVEKVISEAETMTKTDYRGIQYQVRVFTIELNAKEMTDDVTFQVKRGSSLGEEKHYSVVSYARAILSGGYSDEAKDLCRAMLNYGAYAQMYFGYKPGILPNADLSYGSDPVAAGGVSVPDWGYSSNDSTGGKISFEGLSLSLKSKVELRLYFKGVDIDESTLECADSDVNVSLETLDSGYQVVVVKGITADKIDTGFQIDFTTGSGSYEIFVSPMYYCYKASSGEYGNKLADLVKALYLYNMAADAYLAA